MNTKSQNIAPNATLPNGEEWLVCALYKFVALPEFEALREPIFEAAQDAGICGTLLLAREGINGTIAGQESKMRDFLTWLKALKQNNETPFAELEWKESSAAAKPFNKLKVRLKKEIVTMGVEDIDPNQIVGTYVEPKAWNALIADEKTTVIDTRNDYEVAIGTFEGAIDPKTEAFGQFPQWADENLPEDKKSPIAMFCTGGIRCEKSTALLKQRGYENVFHLQGGILKYLEEVDENESMWQGECFVFDKRVSVGHGLKEGPHSLCYACGRPLTEEDRASEQYEKGVSCPKCAGQWNEKATTRFRARQKRIDELNLDDVDSKSFD